MFVLIAIPINNPNTFIYKVSEKLHPKIGQKVLIDFNYRLQTGIIIGFPKEIDFEPEKVKEVKEIIDEKPIINDELFQLARWISKYYFCPIGIVLKAMLPAGLNVNTIQNITLKKQNCRIQKYKQIIDILKKTQAPLTIEKLKQHKISALFKTLLEMENKSIIEIERSFKKRIEKRTVNYFRLVEKKTDAKLTPKQRQLFEFLRKQDEPILVSEIANQFSYSVINKLQEKGVANIFKKEVYPDIFENIEKIPPSEFKLTNEQSDVLAKVNKAISAEKFQTFLLYGVTSSGKTEVYIRAMKSVLEKGKTAILLIPEISLTPQTVERFHSHFEDKIAVMHSKLSDRERLYIWNEIYSGKRKIVIGPRSAIFAPLENIGLIIVDEEHENTYKQTERNPLYNGRDMAVLRGKLNNAVVILGSATPFLESYYNTKLKKYKLLEMEKRVMNQILPELTIVDMRGEEDHTEILSQLLKSKIEDRLKKKEQIILFQNRRGYASYIQCIKCGKVFRCRNCDISLTYHSYSNRMICHYCGYSEMLPKKCPECNGYIFNFGSPGTEKIEKNLQFIFPSAKIVRMDSDTTKNKRSYQKIFERMKNGYIDILLGTQMIIKGLDFPNVTLAGIISADVNLNLPDFRAAERNFQHIVQVAGRTGRSEKRGEVIIQTYNPKHYSIQFAQKQDFVGFTEYEFELREKLHYPPFTKLVRLLFTLNNEERLKKVVFSIRKEIKKFGKSEKIIILGPVIAPISKIRKQYRYHIVVKAKNRNAVIRFVDWFQTNIKIPGYLKMQIDVDPISLL